MEPRDLLDAVTQAIAELESLGPSGNPEVLAYLKDILSQTQNDLSVSVSGDVTGSLQVASRIINLTIDKLVIPEASNRLLKQASGKLQEHLQGQPDLPRLFISYAWGDDQHFVENLYHDLVTQGFSVWWDRVNLPSRGTAVLQELRDAIIMEVDRFIPVIGPAALESPNVQYEWYCARDSCVAITPIIRLGDPDLVPADFRTLYVDFREEVTSYDAAFNEFLRFVQEPAAPLGDLINVPPLPAQYIKRQIDIDNISHHIRAGIDHHAEDVQATSEIALQGLGGIGKSVLAAAVANDCQIRRAFPDGVIWLSLGQYPDLPARQADICRVFGDPQQRFSDIQEGKTRLSQLVADKACLVILDDVWHPRHPEDPNPLDAFKVLGLRSKLLFTTRDASIALAESIAPLEVGLLSRDQATQLLRKWANRDDPAFEQVAERLGDLPLALRLAGARLREGMGAVQWLDTFRYVSQMKFGRLANSREESLVVSIELSVNQLPEEDRLLYYTLGIFPEDLRIPEHVLFHLWCMAASDLNDFECHELITVLHRLSLIEVDDTRGTITLHDLLHDYTREKLGDNATEAHQALLTAYNPEPEVRPWYTLPRDDVHDYIYRYLPHHMMGAGRQEELFDLFRDAKKWLNIELVNGRDLVLEQLVVDIWERYWLHDQAAAHRDLVAWIKSGPKQVVGADYSSKAVAVRCAFQSRDIDALALSLQIEDLHAQNAAVRFVFYLNEVDPHSSTAVVRRASQQVRRFGLPNRQMLSVLVPVILLLITARYKGLGNTSARQPLDDAIAILQETVRKVAYVDKAGLVPLRLVTNSIRTLVVKLLQQYLRRMLEHNFEEVLADPTKMRRAIDSIEEYSLFFERPESYRDLFHAIIPYLDREHGSLADIHETTAQIFASEDTLSRSFTNFAIVSRAQSATQDVFDIYRHALNYLKNDEPVQLNRLAQASESIAHNWYSALDRATDIQDEWVAFLKELVQTHINNSPHGYGVTSTRVGRYLYYTMMYYGAIWSRVHPDEEIDLLADYLQQADETEDQQLLLYMIESLGERGTFPENYQGVLTSLIPYLEEVKTAPGKDPALEARLVDSLAVIRNKQREQVDRFLANYASKEFLEQVHRRSYDEPLTELVRRFREFVVDFLMYSNPDAVRAVLPAAHAAIDARTLDEAFEIVIKEALNRIVGEKVFL